MSAVDLLPAGDDVRHDGVDQAQALDRPLEAILAVGNLGLDVQKSLLNDADEGSVKKPVLLNEVTFTAHSKQLRSFLSAF